MGPDQRHPVKAGAFRAPRFAACGLDRLSPARQGPAKQLRLDGKAVSLDMTARWTPTERT